MYCIVVSNTDIRMVEYSNIRIFELFTLDLYEFEYSNNSHYWFMIYIFF
jgi:hypothetical protein